MTTEQNIQDKYLASYGLNRPPFRLSPDPEFYYPTYPHRAAMEVLLYAIRNDEGFMVLVGEAGTGKTLLVRLLLQKIDANKIPAVLVSPSVDPKGILQLILEELEIDVQETDDIASLLKKFQKLLLDLANDEKELLIVVDEAQNLSIETLEQLRMLSNIETSNKKLLQILLIGQPGLSDKLKDPALGQLNQRIVVDERLRQLNMQESIAYVNYRFAQAGRGDLALNKKAGKILYTSTTGIPRLINRLMERTLMFGYAADSSTIEAKHIGLALQTLPDSSRNRTTQFQLYKWICITALCVFVTGGIIFYLDQVY